MFTGGGSCGGGGVRRAPEDAPSSGLLAEDTGFNRLYLGTGGRTAVLAEIEVRKARGSAGRCAISRLGVRRQTATVQTAKTSPLSGVTETELQVARLVAQWLTNRQVAERLFISRYTVDTHLRQISVKLSINNRLKLARLAAADASSGRARRGRSSRRPLPIGGRPSSGRRCPYS
jgi:DNA-binding CsgD family transcriptional regulator